MTDEIIKLYENAGIKKLLYCDICKAQEHALGLCAETKCEPFYPPFTAEKQIELCKWLIKNYHRYVFDVIEADSFETDLAKFTNEEWQDLTEEERKQIKNILEPEVRE